MSGQSASLVLKNDENNVVVCTLWTPANIIAAKLGNDFNLVGNLYSLEGINILIRSLLAKPIIRHIIVSGADLTKTGDALKNFFEKGLDENGNFFGSNLKPEKEIPLSEIESIRKNIGFIDMRNCSIEQLDKKLGELNKEHLPAFSTPKEFPKSIPLIEFLPSEETGFFARANTIGEAWLQCLDIVRKFGVEKQSDFGVKQKEVLNLVSIIAQDDKELAKFFAFSEEQLKEYLPSILSPEKPAKITYTLGSRIFRREDKFDLNQVQKAVLELKTKPYSRRAIAVTWKMEDNFSENPPCLTQIIWNIQNNKLFQTMMFRSQDIFSDYPMNLLALRELQKQVAEKLNLPLGAMVCVSTSAHIYENKFAETEKTLKENYSDPKFAFKPDPRGNFVIELFPLSEKEKIVFVQHFTPDGRKTQFAFHDNNPRQLFCQIMNSNLVSRLDHAFYLGLEIQKALHAMKLNKEYVQDKELEI